jgi:hypothetical protein
MFGDKNVLRYPFCLLEDGTFEIESAKAKRIGFERKIKLNIICSTGF